MRERKNESADCGLFYLVKLRINKINIISFVCSKGDNFVIFYLVLVAKRVIDYYNVVESFTYDLLPIFV